MIQESWLRSFRGESDRSVITITFYSYILVAVAFDLDLLWKVISIIIIISMAAAAAFILTRVVAVVAIGSLNGVCKKPGISWWFGQSWILPSWKPSEQASLGSHRHQNEGKGLQSLRWAMQIFHIDATMEKQRSVIIIKWINLRKKWTLLSRVSFQRLKHRTCLRSGFYAPKLLHLQGHQWMKLFTCL